ncbi:MAG: transcriptional repressor [Lachnospiraceae bacterium]|nr:transcriptional repressor [Lachnospiraceae bacterium]
MTKQRRVILETIKENDKHMTPEEIYTKTREKFPAIAMATVYNNLNSLVRQGIIRRIQVPGSPDHYDRNTEKHEHLICEKCGHMADADPGDFISGIEQNLGIPITRYNLTLYYICPNCRTTSFTDSECYPKQ